LQDSYRIFNQDCELVSQLPNNLHLEIVIHIFSATLSLRSILTQTALLYYLFLFCLFSKIMLQYSHIVR
jgi:hypothetical protein